MENNKKSCSLEDLALHNNSNSDVDSNDQEKNKKELDKKEVIFYSERINEIAGDLVEMI